MTSPSPRVADPPRPAPTARLVAWRVVALAVWVAVGWLVLAPAGAPTGPGLPIPDKLAHFAAWFALAVSLWCASGAPIRWRILVVAGATAAFAVATEALQALSPGRTPDALDALADVAGAWTGVGVAVLVGRRRGGLAHAPAVSGPGPSGHVEVAEGHGE